MWDSFDVHIDGNDEDQRLLRYNTYHNIIATPAHTDHLPIGARGLSCQAYQGAAFWDQEIFNLPMYVYTRPEIARNILRYRHKTLDGARRKADRLGYRGAFYAWISGDTGDELCPDFFFRDVITGRKIRNHFNDWQIHVSPDISYAVWQYYRATGDRRFLVDSGAEILFEVARFLYSHAYYKKEKDRFEIIRVLGPDEYHENVDNSVFTNVQARYALDRALEAYEMLADAGRPSEALADIRSRIGLTDDELAGWREMAEKLYIPQPDSESGLIEQFDGYFELEDVTPDKLAERLIDENEYWGWPNGIAYHTQVTKQADVVQLFALHPAPEYGIDIVRRNYEYYEPRTQHRSSLSPGVHALVASRVGNLAEAERYLEHSLTIDLRNTNPPESGGTFIGGIHTAACGIGWQIVVFGFLGLRVEEEYIVLDPRLPQDWDGIRTRLTVRGHQFEVSTDGTVVELVSTSESAQPLEFRLPEGGARARLAANGRARLSVEGD
jgi:kojibiose phosphorylase